MDSFLTILFFHSLATQSQQAGISQKNVLSVSIAYSTTVLVQCSGQTQDPKKTISEEYITYATADAFMTP